MNTTIAPSITDASTEPNFDLIARPYRWLEYLTLGPALQRCRTHFIPALLNRRNALVLGDGDGRFLAQLLNTNPALQADAVDTSAAMLQLLQTHCEATAPNASSRLKTHHTNALTFNPANNYDLIVTHFFLDCLTQPELEALVNHLAPHLEPGALWLISDFRIPAGPLRPFAQLYVRSLYLVFRLLTGLRTTHLPNHAAALAGRFTRVAQHHSIARLLTTELWQKNPGSQRSVSEHRAQAISDIPAAGRLKAPSAVESKQFL